LSPASLGSLREPSLRTALQAERLQRFPALPLNHQVHLLRTFKGYMKISKEGTPQLARHMESLEGGMLALLGQGTEPS